jgi:hypothetical protein
VQDSFTQNSRTRYLSTNALSALIATLFNSDFRMNVVLLPPVFRAVTPAAVRPENSEFFR